MNGDIGGARRHAFHGALRAAAAEPSGRLPGERAQGGRPTDTERVVDVMPLKKPKSLFTAAAMALCVLAATVVWTLVFFTPASAEDDWRNLNDRNSGGCLAVPNSSTANGTGLVQRTCSDTFDQRWNWYDHEAVSARLYNMATGFCLADANSDTANGAAMIQWVCGNSDSSYWTLQAVTGGYRVINKASGKCLAPSVGGTPLGAQAVQQPCGDGSDQVWIHDSWDRLRNVQSDYCLAIPRSSPDTGTEAIQWTCTDNTNEQWLW